jgi:hypothetical protein
MAALGRGLTLSFLLLLLANEFLREIMARASC